MRSCLYRVKGYGQCNSRASSFTKSCKTLSGCNKHYMSNSPRIKHLSPSFSYWPFLINTSSIDVNYFKCSLQKHRAVSELSTVPFTERCTQTCCIYTFVTPPTFVLPWIYLPYYNAFDSWIYWKYKMFTYPKFNFLPIKENSKSCLWHLYWNIAFFKKWGIVLFVWTRQLYFR